MAAPLVTALTARREPHLDGNRYSARESRQGKTLRIGVRLDARLVLPHDVYISADYWPVLWDTTEKVKLEFDAHGLSIPYPQMDIHIPKRAMDTTEN